MAIFFFCLCGQNLRGDENQVGRSMRCPRCGSVVRVPGGQGADPADCAVVHLPHEPVLSPPVISPVSDLKFKVVELSSEIGPRDQLPPPIYRVAQPTTDAGADEVRREFERREMRRLFAAAKVEIAQRRRKFRGWSLETRWYHCLLYPLRAWLMIFSLSFGWAVLLTFLLALRPDGWEFEELIQRSPLVPPLFVLVGYTCACLQATLVGGATGRAGEVSWPGRVLMRTFRSGAQAIVCLLAGPVVPALVAYFFWIDSGELEWVDRLILMELGILTVGYFALALMSMLERDRFLDANPVAIFQLIQRLGWRVPLTAFLIAVVVLFHGLRMLTALEQLHRGIGGWMLLFFLWAGQLACLLFLLRWLGVSRFQARKASRSNEGDVDEEIPVVYAASPSAPAAFPSL